MGLGHMRRNLLLAQALRHSRLQAVVLMIAGAREASLLTTTAGVDCVALPSLWKDRGGQYHPRHLAVSLEELLALRARTAGAALEAFAPDVAAKVRYTGYLDQRARLTFARRGDQDPVAAPGWSGGRLALCLVGGGQDGAELAEAFLAAALPPDTNGLLVTGPCMPAGVRGRLVRSVASDP